MPSLRDQILANPSILLANKADPSTPIKEWDGLVGAVFERFYYITSPNCVRIPQPPIGKDRPIFHCADGGFGIDDPYQWPQSYCPKLPLFACMPAKAPKGDPQRILWWTPHIDEFEIKEMGGHRYTSPGLIKASHCHLLKTEGDAIQTTIRQHLDDPQYLRVYNRDGLVARHDAPGDWMRRLEGFPAPYHDVCLFVKEYQRRCLELLAIINFVSTVLSRSNPRPLTIPPPHRFLGAFTSDIGIAGLLAFNGVPVWLIRELDSFSSARIDSLVDFIPPTSIVCQPLRADQLAIYSSSSSDPAKIRTVSNYAIEYFASQYQTSDPATTLTVPRPTLNPLPTKRLRAATDAGASGASNAVAGSSKQQSKPTKKVKTAKHQSKKADGSARFVDAKKFDLQQTAYTPSTPLVWSDALKSVRRNVTLHNDLGEVDRGFPFPPPTLFDPTSAPNKRKISYAYISWVNIRPSLLAIAAPLTSFRPLKWSRKEWKNALLFSMIDQGEIGATPGSQAYTDMRGVARTLRDRAEQANLPLPPSLSASYFGTTIVPSTLPSLEICRKVMWELGELCWRADLLDLDAYMFVVAGALSERERAEQRSLRSSLINRVFNADTRINQVTWTQVNPDGTRAGLTSKDPNERRRSLHALGEVVISWTGAPSNLVQFVQTGANSENDLATLEKMCAEFITQSFFARFGRAMSVPVFVD
ncbi:hypothetical protein ONZ45_g10590 [Pleurotus djamor]|nr:hypothetical protein ONZ45_g10590 [Pleurotus djamor]